VLGLAGNLDRYPDRLDHECFPGDVVFSAKRRKRPAASPQTDSRYSRIPARPRSFTALHEGDAEIVFEPRVGGRIFERTAAGHEIDWGRVTEWDPPLRLRYRWHIAADPADATDVEIVFREPDASLTRVEIEHRGWERLGEEKGRAWRDVNHGGWDGVLPACISQAV